MSRISLNHRSMWYHFQWYWIPLLFCFTTSGCAMFDTDIPSLMKDKPEYVTPTQMIPIWTDTVLHSAGKPAMRGCGGRFMFYTPDSKEGVQVDGVLTVYVWNDSAPTKERKPDRKYVFKAEDLQSHYSMSKVGHSYSFWLPWDEVGSNRTELTVVARFVGRNGGDVITPASKVILPGRIPMPVAQTKTDSANPEEGRRTSGIQQVSWDHDEQHPGQRTSTLKTSEIQLTPGFVERNQQSAALPGAFSASDLFGDSRAAETRTTDGGSHSDAVRETNDGEAEDKQSTAEPKEIGFNAAPTIRRSGHSLQSRYQAQRERLARRADVALGTQPIPEDEPSSRPGTQ